ncbi:MAG TPA: DUF308 domain-containing protein [Gaiellaceae bacterium]|nr:DUF308 domain-containing protein [Gaiellaceae bacterium]
MLLNPVSSKVDFGLAEAEALAATWWIYLVAGIVSLVFGAIILSVDWGIDSLAAFLGVLLILQGLAWLTLKPLDDGDRRTNVVAGLLGAGAGLALLVWPDKGLYLVAIFVGVWIVMSGVIHVVGAIVNRQAPHWWLVLVLGLVEIPIGIWLLRRPGMTLAILITLVGIWAIVTGVWQCMIAFELRKLPQRLQRLRPA